MNWNMTTYPNRYGKPRGTEDGKGVIRAGVVERNNDTEELGIAGKVAVVTREDDGLARVYTWDKTSTPENSFTECPLWSGPYNLLSEEIREVEA